MDIENNNEDLNQEVKSTDSEDLQKIIASKVNEELAGIKEKLNAAYSQRDEAVAKAVAFEEEKKKVQIARLEEEGKHKEAADMKMSELNAKLQEREKQITELTRDNVVRDSLKGLDFRNDTAADFAYRDVVAQLVQNENGQWMHKTGASVKDFIDSFRKDEDKEFLFKPKQSSGTGQSSMQAPTGGFDSNKPLSEMSTEEIMAAAASGAFDDGKKWI
jgi:cation transport regulator ChaB